MPVVTGIPDILDIERTGQPFIAAHDTGIDGIPRSGGGLHQFRVHPVLRMFVFIADIQLQTRKFRSRQSRRDSQGKNFDERTIVGFIVTVGIRCVDIEPPVLQFQRSAGQQRIDIGIGKVSLRTDRCVVDGDVIENIGSEQFDLCPLGGKRGPECCPERLVEFGIAAGPDGIRHFSHVDEKRFGFGSFGSHVKHGAEREAFRKRCGMRKTQAERRKQAIIIGSGMNRPEIRKDILVSDMIPGQPRLSGYRNAVDIGFFPHRERIKIDVGNHVVLYRGHSVADRVVGIPSPVESLKEIRLQAHREICGIGTHLHGAVSCPEPVVHRMVGVVHIELVIIIGQRSVVNQAVALIHQEIGERDVFGVHERGRVFPRAGFSHKGCFSEAVRGVLPVVVEFPEGFSVTVFIRFPLDVPQRYPVAVFFDLESRIRTIETPHVLRQAAPVAQGILRFGTSHQNHAAETGLQVRSRFIEFDRLDVERRNS